MKLNGTKIQGPNVETIVIPRGDGLPIVFRAQAIIDMEEFKRLCPMPEPPTKLLPGNVKQPDVEDPHYRAALETRAEQQHAYTIVKSLEATVGLEWDTVKLEEPSSWTNYEKELKDAGFSEYEIIRIHNGVMAANCLNESKVEEARQRFLASQGVAQEK